MNSASRRGPRPAPWRGLLQALLCVFGSMAGSAPAQTSTEAQLKAAYLVNFFKYVEWPQAGPEFRLCVFGRTEVWPHLAPYDGRQVANKPLRVVRLKSLDGVLQCHQVFLPAGEMLRGSDLLDRVAGEAVLSVGESDTFLSAGGAISLSEHKGQLQFDINAKSLQQARLIVSTPMLRLARSIRGQAR